METTIWSTLSFFNQIEHLILFLVLLYPILTVVAYAALALIEWVVYWTTDGDVPELVKQSTFNRVWFGTNGKDHGGYWAAYAVIGGFIALIFLSVLTYVPESGEQYDFHPIGFVWTFAQWALYAYIARYAYRCLRWVRRIASIAHSHKEAGVKLFTDKEPSFTDSKGDK